MSHQVSPSATVVRSEFGRLPDGAAVESYRISNGRLAVDVLTLGGTLAQLWVPDRDGVLADVVLGFDDLAGYLRPHPFLGALIGRFANRIAAATFTLDGERVTLAVNDGPNSLHGGPTGFHTRNWTAEPLPGGVRLRLVSPAGDEGFPAALSVSVDYTLTDGELRIDYAATNTEPAGGPSTVLNLTNHSYFNLAGQGAGSVGDHLVQVAAGRYTPVDGNMIPTGEPAPVDGTPMDLRTPRPFAAGWDAPFEQITLGGGYDHNLVLDDGGTPGVLGFAARVEEPGSGRALEVYTDQPGIQLYSGNQLDGTLVGKGGHAYQLRAGFCLETQHFPDSPNRPTFPSTTLAAGDIFRTSTAFRFSAG